MAAKAAPRTPAQMPSDLVPRSMLPDRPTIPEWQQFGYGAPAPKPKAPANVKGKKEGGHIKKMAFGGVGATLPKAAGLAGRALAATGSMTNPVGMYLNYPLIEMAMEEEARMRNEQGAPRYPRYDFLSGPSKGPAVTTGKAKGKFKGGAIKKYAAGGSISSASRRADGIARKGKTRGKMC